MSLLGELTTISGEMYMYGNISYVPQEAWIFSASLRDNILFGKEYDATQYRTALQASALSMVLKIYSFIIACIIKTRNYIRIFHQVHEF